MDKGKLSRLYESLKNALCKTVLFGVGLNTFWVLSLALNWNFDDSLGVIFNNKNNASASYNIFINLITFNWFYCAYMVVSFVLESAKYTSLNYGLNFIFSFLFGWLINLSSFGDFWYLYSFTDVKAFWSACILFFKTMSFSAIKNFTIALCPVTMYNSICAALKYHFSAHHVFKRADYFHEFGFHFTVPNDFFLIGAVLKNYFSAHRVFKRVDYFHEVGFYFMESNDFFFIGAVLFVISSITSFFMLSYLGFYGVFIFNLITISLFWVFTILKINYFLFEGNSIKIVLGKWFVLWGHSTVNFELYIDSLSYGYILLTLTIALFVFIYTFSYFRYEPNVERLLLLINLFVISMLLLVSSGNFFVLFLGWELIGLTSFFLINFWSTRIGTLKAAFKAMVFNKLSDVSLFVALLLIYLTTYESNLLVINSQLHVYQNLIAHFGDYEFSYLELISFFILIAAFIKSAQFGTHIWLPDSMEAPVPASALIHSATLVSAGVFLVLRFSPIFELSLYADYILMFVGSFTAFFGGWCAIFQSDIKRILAYSTLSHCGFLMATCATKVPELTIFYLYVHGFFKAAVFLCVGNLIRFSNNYQDFRRMGKIWKYMPFECIAALVCLLNLAGLPFTLGFYIKHILFSSMAQNKFVVSFVIFFIVTAAVAGLIYSAKLYFYIFFDFKKGKKHMYEHTNQKNLKTIYYSNTTLAANLAITGLIFVGYVISIYLYIGWFSLINTNEALDLLVLESSNYFNFGWPTAMFLKTASAVNWISLQLIIILVLSVWRSTFSTYSIFDFFFSVVIFCMFFYFSSFFVV